MTEKHDDTAPLPTAEELAKVDAEMARINAEPLPLPTEEERAAFCGMTLEAFRALRHPFAVENDRLREERLAREADASAAPMTKLRTLARTIGASHTFKQYKRSSQMSAMIAAVSEETGATFTCKLERDLIDGSIAGVRVMYKGQK